MTPAKMAYKAIFEHSAVQKLPELTELYSFLQPRKIRGVIEIGSERCGTLWGWSQLATDNAKLVAVDHAFIEEHAHCRAEQLTVLLKADSHEESTFELVRAALGGWPVDLLFIDGDHSYEGARQDLITYSPFMADGGVIVLHDICDHDHPELSEVHLLWNDIKNDSWNEITHEYEVREFIYPNAIDISFTTMSAASCGLGVILV